MTLRKRLCTFIVQLSLDTELAELVALYSEGLEMAAVQVSWDKELFMLVEIYLEDDLEIAGHSGDMGREIAQ